MEDSLGPLAAAAGVAPGVAGALAEIAVEGGTVTHGAIVARTFAMDEAVPMWVLLMHGVGDVDASFVDPSGDTIRADNYTRYPGVVREDGALFASSGEVWQFTQPEAGQWTAIVRGKDLAGRRALDWALHVFGEGMARTATAVVSPDAIVTGQAARIKVSIAQGGSPTLGADSVTAFVTGPDTITTQVSLMDDGANSDSAANDGIYTGSYTPILGGPYLVGFKARENAPGGGPLWSRIGRAASLEVRTGSSTFRSGNNRIREVTSDIDRDGQLDSLFIDADLNIDEAATYSLVGVLTDSQGHPHQASATQALGSGFSTLRLAFSGREFFEQGVDGPYTLTSLMLWEMNGPADWPLQHAEKANSFVTVAHRYLGFESR